MTRDDIRAIQNALIRNGVQVGATGADGIWGRNTTNGLMRFQTLHLLQPTGEADKLTLEALCISMGPSAVVPWNAEAQRYLGLTEVPGKKNNAEIMSWAKELGGWIFNSYTGDDIPWCGLFQAHCFAVTLPRQALPDNPLGALNWAKWGQGLNSPALGSILVFSRVGGGHVGQYMGEDDICYHVLGGNQSNKVSVVRIEKSRCVGVRWPSSVAMPISGKIILSPNSVVSTNEA